MFSPPVFVGTAAAVAFLGAKYITWDDVAKVWSYSDPSASTVTYPVSTGYWIGLTDSTGSYRFYTPSTFCNGYARSLGATHQLMGSTSNGNYWVCQWSWGNEGQYAQPASNCPSGWYVTDSGCVQNNPAQPTTVPLTEEQFVDKVAPYIPPEEIPQLAPGMPIPVDAPVVSPGEGADDTPRPIYVPVGETMPVPNTAPQQYTQPMMRVVPAPTATDPYRVDLQPVNNVTNNSTSINGPTYITNEAADETVKPSDDSDLCLENPDIDACQKTEYDTPDGEIPRDTISASYQVDNFLSGGGSCPADVYVTVHGTTHKAFDWARQCGYMTTYARPLVLVVCAFLSVMIIAGGFKV